MSASRTIEVEAKGSDTVGAIKRKIEQQQGVPLDCQQLIFASKKMDDQHTVDDYNLERLSRPLYLVTQEAPAPAPAPGAGPAAQMLPTEPRAALRPQGPMLLGPWSPHDHKMMKQELPRAHPNVMEAVPEQAQPGCHLFEVNFPELYNLSLHVSDRLGLSR